MRLNYDKPKLSPYKKSGLLMPIREKQFGKIPNLNPDLDIKKASFMEHPT
jgi:hypothetical protein